MSIPKRSSAKASTHCVEWTRSSCPVDSASAASRASLPRLQAAGLTVSAWAKSAAAGDLVEMVELPQHPWFFGCQFHPEFTSNPRRGHPLFVGFIRAALDRKRKSLGTKEGTLAELVASD